MAIIPGLTLGELRQGQAIVDDKGNPTDVLLRLFNGNSTNTRKVVTRIATLLEDIIELNDLVTAAQAAADAAQAAADAAQAAAAGATGFSELTNSYVSGITITATDTGVDASITISAHMRHYPQPDGTLRSVAVTGGTLTGLSYGTDHWIYYDQPSRLGGAVTYAASTAPTAQIGDRHNVGAVTTPVAAGGPVDGNGTKPPGYTGPS